MKYIKNGHVLDYINSYKYTKFQPFTINFQKIMLPQKSTVLTNQIN